MDEGPPPESGEMPAVASRFAGEPITASNPRVSDSGPHFGEQTQPGFTRGWSSIATPTGSSAAVAKGQEERGTDPAKLAQVTDVSPVVPDNEAPAPATEPAPARENDKTE